MRINTIFFQADTECGLTNNTFCYADFDLEHILKASFFFHVVFSFITQSTACKTKPETFEPETVFNVWTDSYAFNGSVRSFMKETAICHSKNNSKVTTLP